VSVEGVFHGEAGGGEQGDGACGDQVEVQAWAGGDLSCARATNMDF